MRQGLRWRTRWGPRWRVRWGKRRGVRRGCRRVRRLAGNLDLIACGISKAARQPVEIDINRLETRAEAVPREVRRVTALAP